MSRLILLLAIATLVWLIYSAHKRRSEAAKRARPRRITTRMVRCDHCGLHVPENEAIQGQGRHYCSEEHRRLAETKTGD